MNFRFSFLFRNINNIYDIFQIISRISSRLQYQPLDRMVGIGPRTSMYQIRVAKNQMKFLSYLNQPRLLGQWGHCLIEEFIALLTL